MKHQAIFAIMALVYVALSNSLKTPDLRLVGLSASNNLTVTTFNYVQQTQKASNNDMMNALSALGADYWNPTIFQQYTWFSHNHLTSQLNNIKVGLTGFVGKSIFVSGPSGIKTVSDAITTIVDALNQAYEYYSGVDPSAALERADKMEFIIMRHSQISSTIPLYANTYQTLAISSPDFLYTLIAEFLYQAASIMQEITAGWAGACSSNVGVCSLFTTVCLSYPDFENYNQQLLSYENNELSDARAALNAEYWQTNVPSLPYEVTYFYNEYLTNLARGTADGHKVCRLMNLVDPAIDRANKIYNILGGSYQWFSNHLNYLRKIYYDDAAAIYSQSNVALWKPIEALNSNLASCQTDSASLLESCGDTYFTDILNIIQEFSVEFNDFVVAWTYTCSSNPTICQDSEDHDFTEFISYGFEIYPL